MLASPETQTAETRADYQPGHGSGRLRLDYLDGLRGWAASYVVLLHALSNVVLVPGWLPQKSGHAGPWELNGQIAVQVFIVLSGYCLMMPVARSGTLKGGGGGFILRRARRILPPYYAALGFSLAVIVLVPGMGTPQGMVWDRALPALTPGVLISHLLLLQDLRLDWIHKINGPMWTIAQEWQIYFVFAFVLLPLWRRAGIWVTVFFAFVVSVALRHVPGHDFIYAAPQFLFLFGVGMLAATINFPGSSTWLASLRDKAPWAWVTAIFWAAYTVMSCRHPDAESVLSVRYSLVAGAAMLGTLVLCTNSVQRGLRNNVLLRFCEWKAAVVVGTFSYSLYLVHNPILALFALASHRWEASGYVALATQFLVAVPLATALSYAFHLVAERPFMLGHPTSLPRAEKAAVLDAAP